MAERRLDNKRKVLRKGESQRADGTYDYRWTSRNGKRHSVYAKTLDELRMKEEQIMRDTSDPIRLYSLDEITEIFGKLGLRICNSFADFSGKPSSDNDIQLMVYSIRE